jgi:hypothetical protein
MVPLAIDIFHNYLDNTTRFALRNMLFVDGNRWTARIGGGVKARQGARIKQSHCHQQPFKHAKCSSYLPSIFSQGG